MKKFILLAISTLLLSSCVVSKKKYEASLADRSKLRRELNSLQKALQTNISAFETMKNELHRSNALKSDEMSELFLRVTQLTDANKTLENKLSQTVTMYQSQKQTSQSTAEELKTLRANNIALKRDTASIKYALQLSKERFAKLENELNIQKNKYSKLISDKRKLTTEMEADKQKLALFEQQLVRNKEKMEAISKALIELRKEMLSSKTANTSIDPNKNKHIDRMARELGHY
ncbi:hypothetical protein SAMN06265379_101410 [Saccharicrinis carchari]|uniref:Uncharacterized protein n=1 Tax=Saccharicrinis carchari TaxID=1168039 RepID=A0A521AV45_SACCC|nr:hypothetical protein [Saccharicrinis carchari]SMO38450.1 hypothetical protein SAMN06265379_101410 [Saccharicrinis carchari]